MLKRSYKFSLYGTGPLWFREYSQTSFLEDIRIVSWEVVQVWNGSCEEAGLFAVQAGFKLELSKQRWNTCIKRHIFYQILKIRMLGIRFLLQHRRNEATPTDTQYSG